jgi:hypothetical protein
MKLTIETVLILFNSLKLTAYKHIQKKNYSKAIKYINKAAYLAYLINWKYNDNQLNYYLMEISSELFTKEKIEKKEGKVIFWDSFSLDNRGLTEQYIGALIKCDYEILYITENNNSDQYPNIIKTLENYKKAKILIFDSKKNILDGIRLVRSEIINFDPTSIWLHIAPWSSEALIVVDSIVGPIKYLINLTDHAFWLGSKIIDNCIEFRSYGREISIKYRSIRSECIYINPYYPIVTSAEPEKLPDIPAGSTVVFSGAAYYKVYGKNKIFLDICKKLLIDNKKLIIFFAGNGYQKPLLNFIKKNNFESRFYLIGNRKDINHVMSNCDIYLGTYPFLGGLMAQLAAYHGKPILSYTTTDLPVNYLDDIVDPYNLRKITFDDLDSFYLEANKLIGNTLYRQENTAEIRASMISPRIFNDNTRLLISGKNINFAKRDIVINIEAFRDLYLDIENNYQYQFKKLLARNFYTIPFRLLNTNVIYFGFQGFLHLVQRSFEYLKIFTDKIYITNRS